MSNSNRIQEIKAIVNGSRYEQGRYYDLHGSSFGPGPKYRGDAGELLKELLSLVKEQEAELRVDGGVAAVDAIIEEAINAAREHRNQGCFTDAFSRLEHALLTLGSRGSGHVTTPPLAAPVDDRKD